MVEGSTAYDYGTQLDEIVESRARILNFLHVVNPSINTVLEYLYDVGLRRDDMICILVGFASEQLEISDLVSDEPLFQLLDYSLNILMPWSD